MTSRFFFTKKRCSSKSKKKTVSRLFFLFIYGLFLYFSERWCGSVRDRRTFLCGGCGHRLLQRRAEAASPLADLLRPDGSLRRDPHRPAAPAAAALPAARAPRGDHRRVFAGPTPDQMTRRSQTSERGERAGGGTRRGLRRSPTMTNNWTPDWPRAALMGLAFRDTSALWREYPPLKSSWNLRWTRTSRLLIRAQRNSERWKDIHRLWPPFYLDCFFGKCPPFLSTLTLWEQRDFSRLWKHFLL